MRSGRGDGRLHGGKCRGAAPCRPQRYLGEGVGEAGDLDREFGVVTHLRRCRHWRTAARPLELVIGAGHLALLAAVVLQRCAEDAPGRPRHWRAAARLPRQPRRVWRRGRNCPSRRNARRPRGPPRQLPSDQRDGMPRSWCGRSTNSQGDPPRSGLRWWDGADKGVDQQSDEGIDGHGLCSRVTWFGRDCRRIM